MNVVKKERNWIFRLSSLGVTNAEERQNRLTEVYAGFTIIGMLLYAATYLIMDRRLWPQIVVQLVFIVPPVISLYLIRKQKINLAKIVLCYAAPWPVVIGSLFFLGKEAGTHFYLLLFATLPFTLWSYSGRYHINVLFYLNLGLFFFIEIFNPETWLITRLPEQFIRYHTITCYITCFVSVGVVLLLYQIAAEKYEEALHKKSDALKRKNRDLRVQKEIISEVNLLLKEKQEQIEEKSAELRHTNRMLKETLATKDKFFSIIAHDLKNPLGTLMRFAELLQVENYHFNEEKKSKIFQTMYKSSVRTYALLENLLLWSRAQTNDIIARPELVNLYDLVQESVELHDDMRRNKNIDLAIDVDRDQKVFCDRFMILSVFNNLQSNAIKFTPENGKITISTHQNGKSYVEVCVEDTGLGIPKKDIAKLFKPDKSFSTAGTQNETGSGLGLMLCKEFIDKHEGRLRVISKVGRGSKFYFTLRGKATDT